MAMQSAHIFSHSLQASAARGDLAVTSSAHTRHIRSHVWHTFAQVSRLASTQHLAQLAHSFAHFLHISTHLAASGLFAWTAEMNIPPTAPAALAFAPQQAEQSTSQIGQSSQPVAQAGHGAAQHCGDAALPGSPFDFAASGQFPWHLPSNKSVWA